MKRRKIGMSRDNDEKIVDNKSETEDSVVNGEKHDEECSCGHDHDHEHHNCEHEHKHEHDHEHEHDHGDHDHDCCSGHHHDHDHDHGGKHCCCEDHNDHDHGHGHHHHGCSCCDGDDEHELPGILDKILIIAGLALGVLGFVMKFGGILPDYSAAAFVAAYIALGCNVFYGLVFQLLGGEFFSENMLMTIASIGAITIDEPAEGMLVMLLFRIGEFLEEYASGKAEKNISDLLNMKPKTVRKKLPDGKFRACAPENLVKGDIISVKPGEIIGADGYVVSGSGEVNTSSITGESLPVGVSEGSEVLFGYINVNSPIDVCVTQSYADGTFSKIINAMEENLDKKSKSETFIKKFAKVYTPAVMILALVLFLAGGFITGEFKNWLYRALMFLAVSCPCALVISVPLTFFVGLGFLSKKGLLLKGSYFIERLAVLKNAAFDKTGTLTDGHLTVSGILPENGCSASDILSFAYALEKNSNHPVAKAVCGEAEKQGVEAVPSDSVEEISGMGMKGIVGDKTVFCGNTEILKLAGVEYENTDKSFSGIYVACDGVLVGRIVVSDSIREGSAALISGLRTRGVSTYVLTGDRGAGVEKCREKLSPDKIFSGLLPHEKSKVLEDIIKETPEGGTTLYLGDGINDAPVIALADVGLAMGLDGADVTIETADGLVMNNKPEVLLYAIDISKRIVAKAKFNVVFALAVKLAVLLISALGYGNMLLAMFADVGVLVLVVINSLRGYKIK